MYYWEDITDLTGTWESDFCEANNTYTICKLYICFIEFERLAHIGRGGWIAFGSIKIGRAIRQAFVSLKA